MKKDVGKALVFWGIALLILFVLAPLKNADNLYDSVIRLHVIPHSDSEEDQNLKLLVRDRILEYAESQLAFSERDTAEEIIQIRLNQMKAVAENTLEEMGKPMPVAVSLSKEAYPTRAYGDFMLPAGEYTSLQVKIGSGEGQNWWCVLFPPLCINSALGTEDALLDAGMNEENVKTVTKKGSSYEIRFKILELWSRTKSKIEEIF